MAIKFRRYNRLVDFLKVYDFCVKWYDIYQNNGICAPFWEYGQNFPDFDNASSHRIGLWENDDELVGLCTYEIKLGEAYFTLDPNFSIIANDMIEWASNNLMDNKGNLVLIFNNGQNTLKNAALKHGFNKVSEYEHYFHNFNKNKLLDYKLPNGYRFMDNKNEIIDIKKLDTCLHYGFNHFDEPDGDLEFRIHMSISPHFNYNLNIIVIDEKTSDYVSYAGIWIVEENKLAYLEPFCTHPDHRHKGIGSAVISEAIRRAKIQGATHLTGGTNLFYKNIGYESTLIQEIWKK